MLYLKYLFLDALNRTLKMQTPILTFSLGKLLFVLTLESIPGLLVEFETICIT